MTIRRAILADAPQLAELSGTLGYPVEADTMRARLERLLESPDNVVLVAAAASGPVAGWLHGIEQEFLETGRRCEIAGLVVDEACRGRGVGRQLVAALESWASDRGLPQMVVRSNIVRAESHPFYERIGYVRFKSQHVYRKPLADERTRWI